MSITDQIDPHYSRALDEIFRLRREAAAAAYTICLVLDTAPKGSISVVRTAALQAEADRLKACAQGDSLGAQRERDVLYADYQEYMDDAGAAHHLTRAQWEAEAR